MVCRQNLHNSDDQNSRILVNTFFFRYNILTVLTALNLLNWIYFVFSPISAEHFVLGQLTMCDAPFDRKDQRLYFYIFRLMKKFCRKCQTR
jgi:hypothetical protein